MQPGPLPETRDTDVMPPVIVGAAALAASYAAGAIAIELGASTFVAGIISAVAGIVVSTVGSLILSSINRPSVPDTARDRKQAVRSAIEPRRVTYGRALVAGPIVYMTSTGADNEYFHMVMPVGCHVIDDFEELMINGESVPLVDPGVNGQDALDRAGGGSEPLATATFLEIIAVALIRTHAALMGSVRAHTYDGTQTAADAALVAESGGEWTADHKLLGTPYVAVRIKYSQTIYPSGFQSIAAVIRGNAEVYDPRDASTGYTDNPALCIRDYLVKPYGLACGADEIDEASFIVAANICDELVALDEAETTFQPRYQMNGSFKLDREPADIMERMLTSCGGTLTYVQGKYRLHAAAYDMPAITLDEGDFAGPIQVITSPSRKDLFNAIRGKFIDPNQKWAAVEFPMVTNPDFEADDGEQIAIDVEYDFTTDSAMAQRLSRIQLLRHRFGQMSVVAPLKYSALRLAAWDTVAIDFADLGWSGRVFRVRSWKYDPVSAQVLAELQEEDSDSYAWTALDAAPPLDSPDSTLVDPLIIPAPTGLTLTATTSLDGDGHIVPALLAEWTAASHPFVTAVEVQWKRSADTAWSAREVPMPTGSMIIAPVIAGVAYDVRVRAIAGLVRGAWSSTSTETAAPDTTAPGPVTSLAATGVRGGISLTWTNPSDADFDSALIYEAAPPSYVSTYIGATPGAHFLRSGISGAGSYDYEVFARDRSGNISTSSGTVSASPVLAATVDLATNAVTQGMNTTQNDTIGVTDTATFILEGTIDVPAGGEVWIFVRADFDQGSLPGDSGGGGGLEGGGPG